MQKVDSRRRTCLPLFDPCYKSTDGRDGLPVFEQRQQQQPHPGRRSSPQGRRSGTAENVHEKRNKVRGSSHSPSQYHTCSSAKTPRHVFPRNTSRNLLMTHVSNASCTTSTMSYTTCSLNGIVREFVTGGFKMHKNSRILTIF